MDKIEREKQVRYYPDWYPAFRREWESVTSKLKKRRKEK